MAGMSNPFPPKIEEEEKDTDKIVDGIRVALTIFAWMLVVVGVGALIVLLQLFGAMHYVGLLFGTR